MIDLFVSFAAHFLKHVRANAHATRSTKFVSHFSERRASVFSSDALVMVEQIFGNRGDGGRAFRLEPREFLGRFGTRCFNFRALPFRDFLDFLQSFFRNLDAPVVLFARHHLLEQPVFGLCNFVFSSLRFMLESLKRFIRLHLIGLIPIFLGLFFPLLDIQLIFLAIFQGGEVGGLGMIEFRASRRDASFHSGEALRELSQPRSHVLKMSVDGLEVKQMLDDGLHETTILAQRGGPTLARRARSVRQLFVMQRRVRAGNADPDARFAVAERVFDGGKYTGRRKRKRE